MGIAAAVAGGIALFGMASSAEAGAASAENSNQQRLNDWMQGEWQKGIDNGSEMFKAVYQTQQQADRNRAIQKAAYLYKYDSLTAAKEQLSFTHNQLSKNYRTMKGTLKNSLASQGIRGGTAKALQFSQSLNFLGEVSQAESNFKTTRKNINRQTSNMMSKQTNNLFIPNLQGPSARPELASEEGFLGSMIGMDPILSSILG